MFRRRVLPLLTLTLAIVLIANPRAFTRVDLELSIGTGTYQLEIDDVADFRVFVSYFDALDQSGGNLHNDFAALHSAGVDGIRIMVNWWTVPLDSDNFPQTPFFYAQDTLFDPTGDLRAGPLSNLLYVLDEAKEHELLVDLTITAETVADCETDDCEAFDPNIASLTLAEYTDAIEELTTELAGSAYKHVFFDLQNEYNKNGYNGGSSFSDAEIAGIVTAVKTIDSGRIVTASMSQEVSSSDADDKADSADLDIVAWHEPRTNNYWQSTGTNVGNLDNGGLPVYLQEPERRRLSPADNTSWTTADNWALNVYNAKQAGADAWTLHPGGSFEFNGGQSFFSNLQLGTYGDEEEDLLDCLAEALAYGTCSSPPAPDLSRQSLVDILVNWLRPVEKKASGRGRLATHGATR